MDFNTITSVGSRVWNPDSGWRASLRSFLCTAMNHRSAVPADEAPAQPMPPDTLVSLLNSEAFSNSELYERYGAAATIVKHMLGIIPNSGHYFEIWPPANRICFTIVPNFLNAPFMLFGLGAPKQLVSLAMFASSIGADCPYCISHTCTFSMRRGVETNKLTLQAISTRHEQGSVFSDVEKAVLDVAESIGNVPCTLTDAMKKSLTSQLDEATVEWIVVVIGMMGFLNKSMDALGIPLEVPCFQETRDVLGDAWSPRQNAQLLQPDAQPALPPPARDSILTYLKMMMQGPSAAAFERKALAGIPDTWAEASEFLQQRTGHTFPLLQQLQHRRVIRAIAAVVNESLSVGVSVVGMKTKVAIAQIFATIARSQAIQAVADDTAAFFHVEQPTLHRIKAFALEEDPISTVATVDSGEEDVSLRALFVIAHASSSSPVRITEKIVAFCKETRVSSAAIVEVVAWVSVLQMLHRISVFYEVGRLDEEDIQP